MLSSIGPLEIILVIVVLLVIFGPKRLPSLGTGMREFKESITGEDKHPSEREPQDRPALTQAQADAPAPAAAPPPQAADAASEQRG